MKTARRSFVILMFLSVSARLLQAAANSRSTFSSSDTFTGVVKYYIITLLDKITCQGELLALQYLTPCQKFHQILLNHNVLQHTPSQNYHH